MYLSALKVQNFRQFGADRQGLVIQFNKGVTALVGENDAGKSSVIDALRLVLQTRDGEYVRLQPDDFHIPEDRRQAHQIKIVAKFSDLSTAEQGALSEYVTFAGQQPVVYIHWTARRLNDDQLARRWVDIAVRSGHDGGGPSLDANVRQLLAAAYLRPLRDAEREMSPGRGSRLSQVLKNFPDIKNGADFDGTQPLDDLDTATLSLAGLAEYLRHLVNLHEGVKKAQGTINENYLSHLALEGDDLYSRINFAEGGSESARLRQILERLELGLLDQQSGDARGAYGLGSNNLLFMACELLLLGRELDGLPLLLIEEPEAHLHPQRQLRLMEFLEAAAKPVEIDRQRPVQVILTTHSPNLSSKIALNNLVLMHRHKAYSLSEQHTKLDATDYRFLARFLDVTKANLFFARGVVIVEGDGEAILLPALAKIMDRDFTRHGVSVVNVGGTGLGRYSRILQRAKPENGTLNLPVARIADMDVMPDCAPAILGLVDDDDDPRWNGKHRRWKAMRHFGDDEGSRNKSLSDRRVKLKADDAQNVETFVADHWTLEYDLAFAGLAKQLLVAARLAENDDVLNQEKKKHEEVIREAETEFGQLSQSSETLAHLCSHIYSLFTTKKASKAITAQYLVDVLDNDLQRKVLSREQIVDSLPGYLKEAITYATTRLELLQEPAGDVP
ncbi:MULTISPECIES: AAA family ATPase [unclassified Pseudomonas]|uniref:ATP-dependent nuclease n=1 Tax=unclassified Pseudomonas TaxID=196821 RepID=UPI00128B283C|nr:MULTISPECIES: AAA family ATPase [unclassified Pseudomonas]MPQ71780.1 AAA family ATPase [Pseudomonas sp. MWU12-2323]